MMKPTMEKNDLISRSDFLKEREGAKVKPVGPSNGSEYTAEVATLAINTIIKEIKGMPTVDAAPVVHGEIIWKNRKKLVKRYDAEPYCFDAEANPLYHATNKHITEKVAYCPVCKKRMNGDFLNFCDNCGARMDGKDDENENR